MQKNPISIQTTISAPLEKVWRYWTEPEHLEKWNHASDDWESRDAKSDLRVGGHFSTVMAAKDGSVSFEFGGVYTVVDPERILEYDMSDTRHVKVEFSETPDGVEVKETFDPESHNSLEKQRDGWQAILDNFKKYVEAN